MWGSSLKCRIFHCLLLRLGMDQMGYQEPTHVQLSRPVRNQQALYFQSLESKTFHLLPLLFWN